MTEDDQDQITYTVVVNHEEQYSIWPVDKELPVGWKTEGTSGSRAECLEYIEKAWPDIRPLSLRKKTQERT